MTELTGVILPGSPEFEKLPVEEQKARVARILDRASSIDRLHVELPEHMYGEWVPDDPLSLAEANRKGFVIDEVYAPKFTIHGSNRMGDVVFMVMPKSLKLLYDARSLEMYNATHGKKGKDGRVTAQREDIEFKNSPIGLPVIDESSSQSISGVEIEHTLKGS